MITRWIARQVAALAHDVVDEYRKLDPPAPAARAELNCTQAVTSARWQPHEQAPASARAHQFGFTRQPPAPDPVADTVAAALRADGLAVVPGQRYQATAWMPGDG